jgi:hypothetical protein
LFSDPLGLKKVTNRRKLQKKAAKSVLRRYKHLKLMTKVITSGLSCQVAPLLAM